MLLVKVELHSALTGRVSEIARMVLWNTGSGTALRGNYKGHTLRKLKGGFGAVKLKGGEVEDYPRKSKHVWHLVSRMLRSMGYD